MCCDDKTYEEAGVNIPLGDKCSEIAYKTCKDTYKNRKDKFGEPEEFEGGFSGPIKINQSLKGSYLVKNSDGVGSKALIAQRLGKHNTVAFDLIAMNADDAVSIGAEPFVATNSLDIKEMDVNVVEGLMAGLKGACKKAKIAMVGGEIAELGEQVEGHDKPYIWNADMLGVLEKEKLIDGRDISPGDKIIALKSNGIRSNGLTLARKICRDNLGKDWHNVSFDSKLSWGEVLLKPSKICCSPLLDILGRYQQERKAEVKGIAHITGGGISNLKRVLPSGLGAKLSDLFEPQLELLELQKLGPVSDEEAYKTWNMGQCFLLISSETERVQSILNSNGVKTKVAGEVIKEKGIKLESKGVNSGKIRF